MLLVFFFAFKNPSVLKVISLAHNLISAMKECYLYVSWTLDIGFINPLSVLLQGPFTAHVTESVKEGVKHCTAKISHDSYKLWRLESIIKTICTKHKPQFYQKNSRKFRNQANIFCLVIINKIQMKVDNVQMSSSPSRSPTINEIN